MFLSLSPIIPYRIRSATNLDFFLPVIYFYIATCIHSLPFILAGISETNE